MRMDASDAATGERIVMSRSGARAAVPVGARPRRARKCGAPSGSRVQAPPARVSASAVRAWLAHRARAAGHAPIRSSWPFEAAASESGRAALESCRGRQRQQAVPAMLMLRARESRAGRPVPGFIVVIAEGGNIAPGHHDGAFQRRPRPSPLQALTTIPLQSRPARGPPNPWSPGRATSRPFFLLSVCDRTAPAYSQNNHNAQRASRRGRLVDRGGRARAGGGGPEGPARRRAASPVARRPRRRRRLERALRTRPSHTLNL